MELFTNMTQKVALLENKEFFPFVKDLLKTILFKLSNWVVSEINLFFPPQWQHFFFSNNTTNQHVEFLTKELLD